MWACGYFALGPIPMKPYGESALDLAAPFFPAPSGIFGTTSLPPDRPGEDFAWLGAGMMVLVIAALIRSWRQIGGMARAHLPSIMVCGLLIIFAVTYVVRIGSVLILGIEPERVRQAVLDGTGHAGTLRILLGLLGPADYARIGLYGVLLVGLAALVVIRAWQWQRFRFLRFMGLVLLVGIVTLVARPSVAALVISSFQGSARFAWPVVYLTGLLAIAGVWTGYSPRTALILLVVALCLQVYDTAPLWNNLRHDAASQPQTPLDEQAILTAIGRVERVILVPNYLCAYAEPVDPTTRDAVVARIVDLQVLVSRSVRPINSVRNSRMTATDIAALSIRCNGERQAAQAQVDAPGTMTIVLNDTPSEALLRAALMQHPGCSRLPSAIVCAGR